MIPVYEQYVRRLRAGEGVALLGIARLPDGTPKFVFACHGYETWIVRRRPGREIPDSDTPPPDRVLERLDVLSLFPDAEPGTYVQVSQ